MFNLKRAAIKRRSFFDWPAVYSGQTIWYNQADMTDIQYISEANGNPVGVIVPIESWHEIESENETAYLLKSEAMKKRLSEAKNRTKEFSSDEFWLSASESSLNEIWNNEEDDVYAELLNKWNHSRALQ